jgi:hypothetical protein
MKGSSRLKISSKYMDDESLVLPVASQFKSTMLTTSHMKILKF